MKEVESKLSLEDLEKFRDEEGFIDLDKAGIVADLESREARGEERRFKHWVNFDGKSTLIKQGSLVTDLSVYSQMIMVELAKQLGMPTAEYDLIKFNGEKGALTPRFNDNEKTPFKSIFEMIGDPPLLDGYDETCDYLKVEQLFEKALEDYEEMTPEEKENLIRERRKQKLFQAFACENDGHTENEGVLLTKTEDGRTVAVIAPMFDTETAFLLDNTREHLEKTLENNATDELGKEVLEQVLEQYREMKKTGKPINTKVIFGYGLVKGSLQQKRDDLVEKALKEPAFGNMSQEERLKIGEGNFEQVVAEMLDGDPGFRDLIRGSTPKSAFVPTEEMRKELGDIYDYTSMADSTLALFRDFIEEDEELEDFMYQLHELDMEAAISAVEDKIKAPVPEIVKKVAVPALAMRKRDLTSVMSYERICQERENEAKLIHNKMVGRKTLKKEVEKPSGYDFLAQIIARSIKEDVSMEEGLSALHELADVTKTKEDYTQEKKDNKDKDKNDE